MGKLPLLTPPCVDPRRLRVYQQNVHMHKGMWSVLPPTHGDFFFGYTHGNVLNLHTGGFQRVTPHTTTPRTTHKSYASKDAGLLCVWLCVVRVC